ncbi:MAG: hypothetical protein CM1200mP2_31630 [Planctomycetaceae bacterium]|nr:MAG: hypothetical protein CM1200mP2_31630 [Planctomycetaceae bacterium]
MERSTGRLGDLDRGNLSRVSRRMPDRIRRPTSAGDLPAQFVFHAVGPIWRGGGGGEEDLLRGCYRRCREIWAP